MYQTNIYTYNWTNMRGINLFSKSILPITISVFCILPVEIKGNKYTT